MRCWKGGLGWVGGGWEDVHLLKAKERPWTVREVREEVEAFSLRFRPTAAAAARWLLLCVCVCGWVGWGKKAGKEKGNAV